MKKILSLLLMFVLVLGMSACKDDDKKKDDTPVECATGEVLVGDKCETEDPGPTDQDLVDAALASLTFDVTEALLDFNLPVTGPNGVVYVWYSSGSAITFNASGNKAMVSRPSAGQGDVSVTLTVVAEKGLASADKTFTVDVPAIPEGAAEKLAEAKKSLKFDTLLDLGAVVETTFLLPNSSPLYDEVKIEWEIIAFADLPNVPVNPGMPTDYVGVAVEVDEVDKPEGWIAVGDTGRDAWYDALTDTSDADDYDDYIDELAIYTAAAAARTAYVETLGEYSYCVVDATADLTGDADTLDETFDIKDADFESLADGTKVFADGVAEAACGWSAYGANGAGGQAFLVANGVWDMYPVYQNDPVDGEKNTAALEPVFAYDQYLIDNAYFAAYDSTVLTTVETADGLLVTVTRPATEDKNVRLAATLSWVEEGVVAVSLDKEFEMVFVQAPQDNATRIKEAKAAFKVFGINFVDGDFNLPVEGLYGTTVTWESSNTNLISVSAGAATVTAPTNNTAVTLTATMTLNDLTETKSFVAVVIGGAATYTYRSSISPTTNINPHNETLANASTLYGWITGGLYTGDIDWDASIDAGVASFKGDFTNTAALVYDRVPYLASSMPVDVNDDGKVYRVSLRTDLAWEDGTAIDADDFMYAYKMLLDPRLANARAGGVYGDVKIVGAEAYAKQTPDADITVPYTLGFETVGIKKIGDYELEFTLSAGMTEWDFRGNMMSGIMGPVHEGLYEAGMNATRTITDYGSGQDKIKSYGPFNLVSWEPGVVFIYERNNDHFDADSYRMTHIRYDVIQAQSVIVNEFKAGRLDVAGVGGVYYPEFKNNPNVVLTPDTATFRWATNIGERGDEETNPLMAYVEFRQALYHAVNRQEMVSSVNAPALANQAYLSPEYIISDTSSVSYRASAQGMSVLADLYPETAGYNPEAALALFNSAYSKAETDGVLPADGLVWVELAMLDAETNWTTNNWVKDVVTAAFDAQPGGANDGKFEFRIAAYSTDALDVAEANANFDIMFYAWSGVKFNPIALMGWVWNENFNYMNEKGWEPGAFEITVNLPNLKATMTEAPVAPDVVIEPTEPTEVTAPDGYVAVGADGRATWYDALTDKTAADAYDAYVVAMAAYDDAMDLYDEYLYDQDYFEFVSSVYASATATHMMTYDEWFNAVMSGGFMYSPYEGKDEDLLNIAAAMEGRLLDEVVGIPLFTRVGTVVYSDRIVQEFKEYHAWMGWGGLKYMYINAADVAN